MKSKIVTLLLLAGMCVGVYARKYQPCIIEKKDGTVIECMAKAKQNNIVYVFNEQDEPIKCKISDVQYVFFMDNDSIRSIYSGIFTNSMANTIAGTVKPRFQGRIQFLTNPKVYNVSIYHYSYSIGKTTYHVYGCYRQGDDFGYDLLMPGDIFSIKNFQKAGAQFFADCDAIVEYITDKSFGLKKMKTVNDLKNLVDEYNHCSTAE